MIIVHFQKISLVLYEFFPKEKKITLNCYQNHVVSFIIGGERESKFIRKKNNDEQTIANCKHIECND